MPKLKPNTVLVTNLEEEKIQKGIRADPDAQSLSDAEWEKVKPFVRLGRPKAEVTKERITIRLSRDVVSTFRATGDGWQTRMDAALKQYIAEHHLSHLWVTQFLCTTHPKPPDKISPSPQSPSQRPWRNAFPSISQGPLCPCTSDHSKAATPSATFVFNNFCRV